MEIRIGTSGWNYRHWRGIFYPKKLPTRKWLSYYSQYFDTVEVNATFYGTPKKETLARWLEETPEGFLFAVKASRFITHLKRLKAVGEALERLFESLSPLYPKLGVILFQLPPSLKYEPELMEEFLSLIPLIPKRSFPLGQKRSGPFRSKRCMFILIMTLWDGPRKTP